MIANEKLPDGDAPPPGRFASLCKFIEAHFDPFAIRRFTRFYYEEHRIDLPSGGASAAAYAFALAEGLDQRGLVDLLLFQRLEEERPACAPQLAELRRLWLKEVPALRPRPSWGEEERTHRERLATLRDALREAVLREAGEAEIGKIEHDIFRLKRKLKDGPELRSDERLGNGRFHLVEVVGDGGFGKVWKAWDDEAGDLVALKVLHGRHAHDRSRVEQFARGARIMHELRHEGILGVRVPVVEEDGFQFFVMDWVGGGDLEQAVLSGRLGVVEVFERLAQVADALAHLHKKGMVHRDVKPANILLGPGDRPLLTDFDLVFDPGSVVESRVIGALAYLAPEADGRPATAAMDVYSLGMCGVFALRRRQFSHHETFRGGELARALSVPASVKDTLCKAVHVDPGHRFPSMAALAEAFRLAATALAEDTKSSLGTARMAIAGGEVAVGARQLDRIVAANPRAADALYERGCARLALGELASAIADFEALDRVCGDEGRLLLDAARRLQGKGDPAVARRFLSWAAQRQDAAVEADAYARVSRLRAVLSGLPPLPSSAESLVGVEISEVEAAADAWLRAFPDHLPALALRARTRPAEEALSELLALMARRGTEPTLLSAFEAACIDAGRETLWGDTVGLGRAAEPAEATGDEAKGVLLARILRIQNRMSRAQVQSGRFPERVLTRRMGALKGELEAAQEELRRLDPSARPEGRAEKVEEASEVEIDFGFEIDVAEEAPTELMGLPAENPPPVPDLGPKLAQPRALLLYQEGQADEQIYPFVGEALTIGRGRENDIQIKNDSKVSRFHTRLFRKGSNFYVEDTKSSNGTLVNGELITERRLFGGEELVIGETFFRFRILD